MLAGSWVWSLMFDQFDRISVVSLPERTDRRRQMRKQLAALNVTNFSFFDAYRISLPGLFRSSGSHGCYLSHLAILLDAAQNEQNVLILQDDCDFLPEVRSYSIPECDIFYGSHAADSDEIVGAHCMGFSTKAARMASSYLLTLLDPGFPPDPKAAAEPGFNYTIRPPIDGALVWFRRAHPELSTAFAYLSKQRPSRSDITPSKFDQYPIVRGIAALARRSRWEAPDALSL